LPAGRSPNLPSRIDDFGRAWQAKALDKLIDDYIAEAKVVVPLPNPNFDPEKFDPSTIDVQAGGLKMPPSKKPQAKTGAGKPSATVNKESMLGSIAKNADVTVEGDSLRLTPTGRRSFLANAKVRATGPVEARLRIRTRADGTARLQWRTEGQELFPATGQSKSFEVAGGDWQELTVPLAVESQIVHLRLFLSDSKRPTEIDWIEIGSKDDAAKDRKRWDFDAPGNATQAKRTKP
jgi:hypothetical protein